MNHIKSTTRFPSNKRVLASRRYTRWFGDEQTAAQEIASYALDSYKRWEVEIENWQNPILQDK